MKNTIEPIDPLVLPPVGQTPPAWTQDQAIAFECAREVITHMMSFYSHDIAEEQDANRRAALRAEVSKLFHERAALRVTDDVNIARVNTEYGAIVRAWNAELPALAA